jgi:hypothetical protein
VQKRIYYKRLINILSLIGENNINLASLKDPKMVVALSRCAYDIMAIHNKRENALFVSIESSSRKEKEENDDRRNTTNYR